MNFKLKTPKSQSSSLILSYVTLKNGKRFVYSTGQKIPVRLWDKSYQVPIRTKSQKDQLIINAVTLRLDKIKTEYLRLDLQSQKAITQMGRTRTTSVSPQRTSSSSDMYGISMKQGATQTLIDSGMVSTDPSIASTCPTYSLSLKGASLPIYSHIVPKV